MLVQSFQTRYIEHPTSNYWNQYPKTKGSDSWISRLCNLGVRCYFFHLNIDLIRVSRKKRFSRLKGRGEGLIEWFDIEVIEIVSA